jgi:hypothetical protein
MSKTRVVAALLMATGAWCAAGDVALLGVAGSERVVVPARFWWAIAGAALAWWMPGFRRSPLMAAPAVLSTLPWWPVPLPAAAFIWTGALAWVPIGLACFAAILARPHRFGDEPATDAPPRASTEASLAGLATLAAALVVAVVLAPRLPQGDEPHYLVVTQSLLLDGDLQIENNHERRDYATYFAGVIAPHYIQRGSNGAIYSVHAPGTSVLVLPLFALSGYRGAQATIALLAGVTGSLIWLGAWLATRHRGAAWFAWAALAGSTTALVQSVMIFPDAPGALVSAAALVVILRLARAPDTVRTRQLVLISLLLAALPWLHTRLAVLELGLAAVLCLVVSGRRAQPGPGRWRALAAILTAPAVSGVLWLVFFATLYGTPNPAAPYGRSAGTELAYIPGGVLGLFFDAEFGLLTYAPVLAAAAVGWVAAPRAIIGRVLFGLALVAGAYLAVVGTFWMWWAGVPATPARFATAILPLFAPALALAWVRAGAFGRAAWLLLLVVTLAISMAVIGVDRGVLAWNARDAFPELLLRIGANANLPRGWPSFFWSLTPGDVTSEWPFAVHVVIWIAILGGTAAAFGAWTRRRSLGQPALVAAWWLPLALTAAVVAGWTLTGQPSREGPAAGLRVLRAVADGRATWEVAPAHLAPAQGLDRLSLVVARSDLAGAPRAGWMPLDDVPAGQYALQVRSRRTARPGSVSVRVGEGPVLASAETRGLGADRLAFTLAAGARRLVVETDDRLAASDPVLELMPLSLWPSTEPARSSAEFEGVQVAFLDDAVFVEPDGFWVRGGRMAALVVFAPGRQRVSLTLTNGAVNNPVTISFGEGTSELSMLPGAHDVRPIPLDGLGMAGIRISSSTGFRPSDHGMDDSRYLGVRVVVQ